MARGTASSTPAARDAPGRALFREADLARALRAGKKAGVQISVVIEPGRMTITPAAAGAPGASIVDEMFP